MARQPDEFTISVRGESSIMLPAERAVLRIDVSSSGEDKQNVAKDTVGVVRKIETLLRKLGPQSASTSDKAAASIDFWTRTSMTETNQVPYDHNERRNLPRVYTAKVDFEAHFQNFRAIGALITNLSALPHTQTKPVNWILKEDTKNAHRSALRIQSAKDAYRKAIEYATALGYEKVKPITLEEAQIYAASSSRKRGPIPTDGVKNSNKNLAEVEEGWEEVDVFEYQPEDIKMSVEVKATFYAE